MNSLWQSGGDIHVKIVVMSLIASIAVFVVATHARLSDGASARVETHDVVVKAGKAKIYTDSGRSTIR